MHRFMTISCAAMLLAGLPVCQAQEAGQQMPPTPPPTKEHQWLQQCVGEWTSEAKMSLPGQPPIECQGTESVRSIGGFWIVAQSNGTVMDVPVTALLTLGYDPETKKYVGTWIDSMTSHMWKYEGTVDPSGKILTLATEGPDPRDPNKRAKFKETLEFKSKDQKVFTSSVQEPDGTWLTMMTANDRRKP